MKISLISPYANVTAIGVRILSATLKKAGHQTQIVIMPDTFDGKTVRSGQIYSKQAVMHLAELCRQSDLIGISLMTNFFDNAVELTKGLREFLRLPIIWGGVHPTIRPEECLEHADMICVGEGEHALAELLDRMEKGLPCDDIPNIGIRKGSESVLNPVRAPEPDLDSFPFPDYSLDDQHVLLGDEIVPMTDKIMEDRLQREIMSKLLGCAGYQTMTSRGCPFACTYCINDTVNRLYNGKGKLRWRSIDNLIEELVMVKKHMKYIGFIWFSDDEFFARSKDELSEFAEKYKKHVGLPFSCLMSPMSASREKMSMMVDAGLFYVQMGVESASKKIQGIFNRQMMNNERMMNAMRIINEFKDKIYPPSYDFILRVPGETDDDIVDSLRFISEIPKPYRLNLFELVPYPGTKIYEIAKENGLIQDERRQIYNRFFTMREPTYLNLLFAFCRLGHFPHSLLKLLVSKPALMMFNNDLFKPCIRAMYALGKFLRSRKAAKLG